MLLLGSALSAAALHREPPADRLATPVTLAMLTTSVAEPPAPAPRSTTQPPPAPPPSAAPAPPPPPPTPPAPPAPPPVVWPGQGVLTGWFGEGRESHRHRGIDLQAPTGAPVVAAAGGTVRHAGTAPAGYAGYGTIVLIDHGEGLVTMYAHLSSVVVRRGQKVAAGERIATVGSTGKVTASHLHFEVRRNGAPTDPRRWLPPR